MKARRSKTSSRVNRDQVRTKLEKYEERNESLSGSEASEELMNERVVFTRDQASFDIDLNLTAYEVRNSYLSFMILCLG